MIAQSKPSSIEPVPSPPRRRILGIRVDDVGWHEVLALADQYARQDVPRLIVTPNPEIVMRARRDPAFEAAIASADLATADGVGLRWAGRLLRQPLREVVPGSELILRMAERAAERGDRWFLLGAAEGVAQEAGRALMRDYPGLVVAGSFSGSPRVEDEDEVLRRIDEAGPLNALFLAYGSPAQELWLARNKERLGVPVSVGVGGAFNFVAGRSKQPPEWVRKAGLIWLFRLVTEPWRWRRQTVLVLFVGRVLVEAVGLHLGLYSQPIE